MARAPWSFGSEPREAAACGKVNCPCWKFAARSKLPTPMLVASSEARRHAQESRAPSGAGIFVTNTLVSGVAMQRLYMVLVFILVTAGALGLFIAMDRLIKPTAAPPAAPLGAKPTPLLP
jgi:hypothetical protein